MVGVRATCGSWHETVLFNNFCMLIMAQPEEVCVLSYTKTIRGILARNDTEIRTHLKRSEISLRAERFPANFDHANNFLWRIVFLVMLASLQIEVL